MEAITKVVDNVFLKYDHNKNGVLESGELHEMFKQIYKQGFIDALPTEGQLKQLTTFIDSDHDGKISKKELTIFVRNLII